MSAWARNRRTVIILGFLTIVGLILFGVYSLFIYQAPTCFDGELNGLEEGIDCGGVCELVCPFSATEPNVQWGRAFQISNGVYNLAGLIENPNFDVKVDATYKFELFNQDNILIDEIFGEVTILPTETKPVFEPIVNTGFQSVSKVFLKLVGESVWTKSEPPKQEVFVSSRKLQDTETDPKLELVLSNKAITPVRDLAITAILYNKDGNVYQSSKTFLEYMDRDSQATIFFTWPEPFDQEVTKIDVFIEEVSLF